MVLTRAGVVRRNSCPGSGAGSWGTVVDWVAEDSSARGEGLQRGSSRLPHTVSACLSRRSFRFWPRRRRTAVQGAARSVVVPAENSPGNMTRGRDSQSSVTRGQPQPPVFGAGHGIAAGKDTVFSSAGSVVTVSRFRGSVTAVRKPRGAAGLPHNRRPVPRHRAPESQLEKRGVYHHVQPRRMVTTPSSPSARASATSSTISTTSVPSHQVQPRNSVPGASADAVPADPKMTAAVKAATAQIFLITMHPSVVTCVPSPCTRWPIRCEIHNTQKDHFSSHHPHWDSSPTYSPLHRHPGREHGKVHVNGGLCFLGVHRTWSQ